MTEINGSSFIKDKEYLLTHDLCDIPGLSEYQETQNQSEEKNNEKEEKKKLDGESKIEEIKKSFWKTMKKN